MANRLQPVLTGHLPTTERVGELVAEAHRRFQSVDEGTVADYIPALALVLQR
jgi:glutaminase